MGGDPAREGPHPPQVRQRNLSPTSFGVLARRIPSPIILHRLLVGPHTLGTKVFPALTPENSNVKGML